MRIARSSSPWLSSLAVLNVLVLAAAALALAVPGALNTSDMMLGVLVIAYLVVLWYLRARHPDDLVEMDTLFFAFFGIYVVLPIVAFVIWSSRHPRSVAASASSRRRYSAARSRTSVRTAPAASMAAIMLRSPSNSASRIAHAPGM